MDDQTVLISKPLKYMVGAKEMFKIVFCFRRLEIGRFFGNFLGNIGSIYFYIITV